MKTHPKVHLQPSHLRLAIPIPSIFVSHPPLLADPSLVIARWCSRSVPRLQVRRDGANPFPCLNSPPGPLAVSGDRSARRGIFLGAGWLATGLENLRTVRSDHDGTRFRLWVFGRIREGVGTYPHCDHVHGVAISNQSAGPQGEQHSSRYTYNLVDPLHVENGNCDGRAWLPSASTT